MIALKVVRRDVTSSCYQQLKSARNMNMMSRSFMSTMSLSHPEEDSHFLLILGKPGGGKGTISGKILKDFSRFHHVSTGDLLRQHVREQTKIGKEAKSYMDEGRLVPDQLMIDLVMDDATPYLDEGQSLLLDGFPRTSEQAVALDKIVDVDLVINLDIPTETIVERIADRYVFKKRDDVHDHLIRQDQNF